MIKSPLSPVQLYMVIVASFIVASVINTYPLSLAASKFRPMALIMVLIFWLLYRPRYVGVGIAFVIGISADLMLDTRLGQQGFAMVIMAFTLRFIGQSIRQLNFSITWMLAAAALFIFQLTLWVLQFFIQNMLIWDSLIGLTVSIAIWPLVYLFLIKFKKQST